VESKELAPLHELIQQFKERKLEGTSATSSSNGGMSASTSVGGPSTSASHTPQGNYAQRIY